MRSEETIHGTFRDGTTVTIVLGAADMLTGMRRSRLIMEMQKSPEPDVDHSLLHLLYCDVAAAMTLFQLGDAGEGLPLPIPFEVFITLSDLTGAELERAIYRLNPHWVMLSKEELEDPKG